MGQVLPNLAQELEALKAELAAEKAARVAAENKAMAMTAGKISFKVSEKGACSVYGLGRFPVTLYKSQWKRLINASPSLIGFIDRNDALLKDKGDE